MAEDTAEGLRALIRESFADAMRVGLKDAELFDEPGAERIEEWITYITRWVTEAVSPKLEQAQAERDKLLALVRDLTDPEPCWLDHHGGCQAHGYISLQPGERCPQAEAKDALAAAGIELE